MKTIFTLLVLYTLFVSSVFSQTAAPNSYTESDLYKMFSNVSFLKVDIDESEKATFKSGTGELVQFYPITLTNLKTKEVRQGLRIYTIYDLQGSNLSGAIGVLGGGKSDNVKQEEIGYMDISEVEEFLDFLENYVLPNVEADLEKMNTTLYKYESKEYEIELYIQREKGNTKEEFRVKFKNRPYMGKYFWTKSQVKRLSDVTKTLRYIVEKAKKK